MAVAFGAGWAVQWTFWQILACTYSLLLLTHFVLNRLDAEVLTILERPLVGLAVLAGLGVLLWWGFVATGHGSPTGDGALGSLLGRVAEVRFVSCGVAALLAVPYAIETCLSLLGLFDS